MRSTRTNRPSSSTGWRSGAYARRNSGLRIMASSSAPLFDRVRDGLFDERLYYRLNVIHMVAG